MASVGLAVVLILPANADVQYVYDEAGRLIQVVDSAGESAQYRYDDAGNIVGIDRFTVTTVSISNFSPSAGSIGSTVTIWGSGFSTTAAQNAVQFNGVAATVTSATTNKLEVTVPVGATTGSITVATPLGSATSSRIFSVVAGSGSPTISGLTPTIGPAGTSVTIAGANFDPAINNNKVLFNNLRLGFISSITSTSIQTKVPNFVASGPISVMTPYGKATSQEDFYIVPSGYATSEVGPLGRLEADGPVNAITINSPVRVGIALFSGAAGQRLGLGFSDLVTTPAGYTVNLFILKPDGSSFHTCTATPPGNRCVIPPLPVGGVYTIKISPNGSTSTAISGTLTLSSDVTGTLTAGGPALTFSTTRVGQSASYSFDATAGQNMALALSADSFPGNTYAYVYKPDGTYLNSVGISCCTSSATLNLANLPATGTYTVRIEPTGIATGSLTVALKNSDGTVAVDGTPTSVSLAASQTGYYKFNGTAGQRLGLGFSDLVTTPAGHQINMTILQPDGVSLTTCVPSAPGNRCTLPVLPVAGTYTVKVMVANNYTAAISGTLTLSRSLS